MRSLRRTLRLSLLLSVVAACGAGADRGGAGNTLDARADSAAGADTGRRASAPRLASDGTLVLVTMLPLTPALRTAADSFAAREAVRVVLDTVASLAPLSAAAPREADIVAVSTTILARFLATGRATWSLPFARNRVVLAWTDSSRRATEIDSASWRRVIGRRDTRIGRADPEMTPLGVHTVLAMQLAETQLDDRGLAKRLVQRAHLSHARLTAGRPARQCSRRHLDLRIGSACHRTSLVEPGCPGRPGRRRRGGDLCRGVNRRPPGEARHRRLERLGHGDQRRRFARGARSSAALLPHHPAPERQPGPGRALRTLPLLSRRPAHPARRGVRRDRSARRGWDRCPDRGGGDGRLGHRARVG
ncbi:MAG: substrate-binding domain-containing protein [Gemmatimonadetes bacterium]|nr:substrate-binding domain-containing protein [Gemmatimonadota bacterium]